MDKSNEGPPIAQKFGTTENKIQVSNAAPQAYLPNFILYIILHHLISHYISQIVCRCEVVNCELKLESFYLIYRYLLFGILITKSKI